MAARNFRAALPGPGSPMLSAVPAPGTAGSGMRTLTVVPLPADPRISTSPPKDERPVSRIPSSPKDFLPASSPLVMPHSRCL